MDDEKRGRSLVLFSKGNYENLKETVMRYIHYDQLFMVVKLQSLICWSCSTHVQIITFYKSGILREARARKLKV
jgi:hypothetical protein